MKNWKTIDAQANFPALVAACIQEPQLLYEHDRPIAAVIDIKLFEKLISKKVPTIRELLDQLAIIQAEDPIELDEIERSDRPNPFFD